MGPYDSNVPKLSGEQAELAIQHEETEEITGMDLNLSELLAIDQKVCERSCGLKGWKDELRPQLEGLEYQVQSLGLYL